jgi:hypothetical protein
MKLLTKHNDRCLVWSAAMVLGEDPQALLDELGHDGLEIVNPQLRKPFCYRGHHKQEIIDLFFLRNIALLNIELYPNFAPRRNLMAPQAQCEGRFRDYLLNHDAILIGKVHAVAWNHAERKIYDPNGAVYKIDKFQIREALVAVPIKI